MTGQKGRLSTFAPPSSGAGSDGGLTGGDQAHGISIRQAVDGVKTRRLITSTVPPGAHIRYDFAVLRVVLFFAAGFAAVFWFPAAVVRGAFGAAFAASGFASGCTGGASPSPSPPLAAVSFDIAIKQFDITRHFFLR
jgi:hypothetical protein